MIEKIVMIGAGNLATQLSLALHEKGLDIAQVYSRTLESAQALAEKLEAEACNCLKEICTDADLYIFAVSDKALHSVLAGMPVCKGHWVHTAGSMPMDIFREFTTNYGVFYPLQTFSKPRKVDFSDIPVCIEAKEAKVYQELEQLAGKISGSIHRISSEQRKQLHLAAVFVCNFANHMYSIGQKLLEEKEVDFDLLRPLIQETAAKIGEMSPVSAQTGPAVRFDEEIINGHMNALNDSPDFQKLYSFVSESIFKMHKNK